MADLTVKENTIVVIKKNKGITHALRDLVKENPNSILSDGKITAKEWNAVLDTLIDINNSRKANNQKPIFTGGTDKSRAGWHSSFVVHPNQKIEFTAKEMSALYSAMGVTLKSSENSENSTEQKVESNPDSTAVSQPAKQDTIPALKTDTVLEKSELDTSKVVPPAQKDSVALPPAEPEKTLISTDDSTAVREPAVEDSSKKSRYELSWGEIGKISLKSAKNFVKGMFCDENGFSLKRTSTTVGVVVGLALAAPAAAAAGASAAVVGGVALAAKVIGLGLAGVMAYHGGKNAIEGGKKYYNSTTEEEAKANMEQAMDGAVEAAAALPAFFAIKGGANKGNKIAKNKASQKPAVEEVPKAGSEVKPNESDLTPEVMPLEDPIQLIEEPKVPQGSQAAATPKSEPKISEPAPKAESKPAEEVKPIEDAAPKAEVKAEEAKVETKAEDVKPAENAVKDYNKAVRNEIVKQTDGTTHEYFYNEAGNIVKSIARDKNGKFGCESIYEYNSNGQRVKQTYRNSNNNIRETFYENGLETKKSWKWANGKVEELKPVGENLYEGVRTYPDGRKVKIKEENYRTIELGPVE